MFGEVWGELKAASGQRGACMSAIKSDSNAEWVWFGAKVALSGYTETALWVTQIKNFYY